MSRGTTEAILNQFRYRTHEAELPGPASFGGTFEIPDQSGLTPGAPVLILQAPGPYTGKGTLADEAEMDLVSATGYVLDTRTIRVHWQSRGPIAGSVKFMYSISF